MPDTTIATDTGGTSPYLNADTPSGGDSSPSMDPSAANPPAPATNQPAQGQPQPSQPSPAQNTPQPQAGNSQPQAPGTVSNAPGAPVAPVHPLVAKAGILSQVAQALAGGPRIKTVVNEDGSTTRTATPLSPGHIGMAIALEAISGALTGLAQTGPAAGARGAALAFAQSNAQVAARNSQQEQQAQTDFTNRANALQQKASNAHVNAQTIAAVSEAEQRGQEAILKLADINRQSGVLDVDPTALDNNGQPMTQDDMMAQMQAGKLSSTDQLGPVSGAQEVTAKDGSKHWESTHLIIKDPETKVELTPEQQQRFHDAGVPGFQNGAGGVTAQVPLRMMQSWNETAASHYLATQRLTDLKTTLQGTPLEAKVPASINFDTPGVATALSRFRYYVSHN
jgi:hypothetical protein